MTTDTTTVATYWIQPATGDLFDRTYRFGMPLGYLSQRDQVRALITRSRFHAAAPDSQLLRRRSASI